MEVHIFIESKVEDQPKQHLKEQIDNFMLNNSANVIKTTEFALEGKICILVWVAK